MKKVVHIFIDREVYQRRVLTLGLTRQDVAKAMGIAPSYLSSLIQNHFPINNPRLRQALVSKLQADAKSLFFIRAASELGQKRQKRLEEAARTLVRLLAGKEERDAE